jgi:hypothetical protein
MAALAPLLTAQTRATTRVTTTATRNHLRVRAAVAVPARLKGTSAAPAARGDNVRYRVYAEAPTTRSRPCSLPY